MAFLGDEQRRPCPEQQGRDYLQWVAQLTPEPHIVETFEDTPLQLPIHRWVGTWIDALNHDLKEAVASCQQCFPAGEGSSVGVYAAPFKASLRFDGLCNLWIQPFTLIVDVGRVVPADWLKLIVHEYAHAHLGHPGHSPDYAAVLTHLCLGLGFRPPPPPWDGLQHWPPYRATVDPTALWRGGLPYPFRPTARSWG